MENTTAELRNMALFNMFKENFIIDIPRKIDFKPCLAALICNPNYQKEEKNYMFKDQSLEKSWMIYAHPSDCSIT